MCLLYIIKCCSGPHFEIWEFMKMRGLIKETFHSLKRNIRKEIPRDFEIDFIIDDELLIFSGSFVIMFNLKLKR